MTPNLVRGDLPLGGGLFHEVAPEHFHWARALSVAARPEFAHFLTPYDVEMMRLHATAYLNSYSDAGYLLFNDGEIANLFSRTRRAGLGEVALIEAIERGGDHVEWFDEPHLNRLYERHGFIEVDRLPFDANIIVQDFPDYDFDRYGRPDYIIAARVPGMYIRAKKAAAFAEASLHAKAENAARAEAARWEEKLRDLVGPVRDTRTPQQRLDEGGW